MKRKTLEVTSKHLTKSEKSKKELIEKELNFRKDYLKNIPDWLINDIARNEWNRLVNEFESNEKSMICNLDYNNLGAYCNSFASYIELSKKVNTNFGLGTNTNPYIPLLLKYSDEMRKYANMLGLSLESRLKKATEQVEKKETDIKDEFGDI